MNRTTWFLMMACVILSNGKVHAQAYCALRDPASQIYELFPEANAYRSVVRTVGESARKAVAKRLPFELHFNELGKHTLYFAKRDGVPIGLVHVRSEKSRWGLVEVAWGLRLDLTVVGFKFQRCRSLKRRQVEHAEFQTQLRGKDIKQLRRMLNRNGTEFVGDRLNVPDGAEKLALVVLRSALKTIVVTEEVWNVDLKNLGSTNNVDDTVGEIQHVLPNAQTARQVGRLYPAEIQKQLRSFLSTETTGVDRDSVTMFQVYDRTGEFLGVAANTPWKSGEHSANLWWAIAKNQEIAGVHVERSSSDEIRDAFTRTIGISMGGLASCSTQTELVAAEMLIIAGPRLLAE